MADTKETVKVRYTRPVRYKNPSADFGDFIEKNPGDVETVSVDFARNLVRRGNAAYVTAERKADTKEETTKK